MTDESPKITWDEVAEWFGQDLPIDVAILMHDYLNEPNRTNLRNFLQKRGEIHQAFVRLQEEYDGLAQDYHDLVEEQEHAKYDWDLAEVS